MCSFLSLNQYFESKICISGFNRLFDRFDSAFRIFFSWTWKFLFPSYGCPFLCMMSFIVCIDAYKYIFFKKKSTTLLWCHWMLIFKSSPHNCCRKFSFFFFRFAELLWKRLYLKSNQKKATELWWGRDLADVWRQLDLSLWFQSSNFQRHAIRCDLYF